MPTTYTDQALGGNFDPGVPPTLPASVTVISISLYDSDDDGLIEANGADQVNGSNVTRVWDGDTVTIDGVTHVGVTFYTADGGRYFTPSDGSVLSPGTATATTFVTTSSQFDVGDLGPPCFTPGTLIRVPGGQAPVETLNPGNLVLTMDRGPRRLRWCGQRSVSGRGRYAPIRFAAGVLGNARPLLVSPQHRMLVTGWRAELMFGSDEVLVPAVSLIDNDRVNRVPCDQVTYCHMMFDRHEIIWAEGAATESFLAGGHHCRAGSALERELASLFPELAEDARAGIAARRLLRGHEGRVLART